LPEHDPAPAGEDVTKEVAGPVNPPKDRRRFQKMIAKRILQAKSRDSFLRQ